LKRLQRTAGNRAATVVARQHQGGSSRDLTRLSDSDLEAEHSQLQRKLQDTTASSASHDEDLHRLREIETELGRRSDAARERAPATNAIAHLVRLAHAARSQSGGPDFAKSVDEFRTALQAKLTALAPGDPLPPDLKIVMVALALWTSDPGNKWGEGSWDSKDLTLGAADYAVVPAGQNKCNAYVAEVLHQATDQVFRAIPSKEQPGRFFPHRARDWGDRAKAIPHFPVVDPPVVGDIVSTGGHVGVYLGTYAGHTLYISARDDPLGVFGGDVQHTHGIQIKYAPSGSNVVYRRYQP
jgi:hypothetical protein